MKNKKRKNANYQNRNKKETRNTNNTKVYDLEERTARFGESIIDDLVKS